MNARNVTLSLGTGEARVEILKGINLEVHRGETVALLGPSGSGKSSLMAVLAGLERASGGTIETGGQDFGTLDEDGLARARRGRIGIILQAFHLLPTMTALENVAVPLELAGMDDPFGRAAAGGEQQRVAIARALAPRPEILFADEPTGNLDAKTGAQIMDLLFARQADTGATLFIITHDAGLAARCGRVVEMHDGAILSDNAAAVR
jgi:putative ABC transport system ATP-binding protein